MTSSLTPGDCMKMNLNMLYDTAFKYVEQANVYEKSNEFIQAKQMYIKGIESFLTIIKYETNVSKKQLIQNNIKAFIIKAETIQQKIQNNENITPSAPPICDIEDNDSNYIKIPIQAISTDECIENETFYIEIAYDSKHSISDITDKIISNLNENIKYFPKKYSISYIDKRSFIGHNICDKDDLLEILAKSITEYDRYEIISKGMIICVKIAKYIHNPLKYSISCKYLLHKIDENDINDDNYQIDPCLCPIYNDTMHKNIFNKNNLNHLKEFSHFRNDYIEKPECKFNPNCTSYYELEHNHHRIEDLCHVQLFRHPPRSSRGGNKNNNIKLEEYINNFIIHKDWNENHPIYEPTEYDKIKYKFSKNDGFLNALIEELKTNGFESDLYDTDYYEKKGDNYPILEIVDNKLNCLRHRAMGSPLNRAEMLSLVLYTSCDCNYELSLSQRNGDYMKWKWFDYCLYFAIFNLSLNETGDYKIYSGVNNVKLNNIQIKEGYFVNYVSATWMKHVAMSFINGEGMLIEFDKKFRNNDKIISCDVSWISPFVDECEIIIARSDEKYCKDNFTAKVIDDHNGIQTVYIDKL